MKSPEAASPVSPEKKSASPDRGRERSERVEDLKRELKVAFWDLQSRDGMQVTVVDFANDPSFAERLNKAKQSGLTTEEMGEAVDFIKDNYGKKRVLYKETVSLNDGKYSVTTPQTQDAAAGKESRAQTGAETIKDPIQDASDRFTSWAKAFDKGSAKRYEAQRLADEQWSSEFRGNLARIAAEAEMRHQKETQAVEEKSREDAREFEEMRAQREREAAEQRAQSERGVQARLEKQKQVDVTSLGVEVRDLKSASASRENKEADARISDLNAKYFVTKNVDQPAANDPVFEREQKGFVNKPAANDSIFETAKQDDVVGVEKPVALEIPSALQAVENIVASTEEQGQPLQAEVSAQIPSEEIIPDLNLPSSEVNVSNIVTPVASVEQFQLVPVQAMEAEKTTISDTEQVPVAGLVPDKIVRSAEPITTSEAPLAKVEEARAGVETNESPAFRETLQEFTKSYVTLFKDLRQYNNETLDRKGRETSESVLFNADIEDVVAFLSVKNTESGLADEVTKIEKVRAFLAENLFPVRGGMQISSIEGYDFLIRSLGAFGEAIQTSQEKIKDLGEAKDFNYTLQQVRTTFGNLNKIVNKKKQLTLDYLSR